MLGCAVPTIRTINPTFIEPMLLELVRKLPEGDRWQYEVKWDGYGGIAVLNGRSAHLWSRNEKDLGKRLGRIVEAVAELPVKNAVLDGEIVVLDEAGKPSFQDLQYFNPKLAPRLYYYVFDLLLLNGKDLTKLPLEERRAQLAELLTDPPPALRLSSTLEAEPKDLIAIVRAEGLEGIVAKDRTSFYEPGKRSGKWQKFKLYQEEEFLIAGFIPDGKAGVESVVLGKHEKGELRYVACLDVRLPREASRASAAKLDAITTAKCPFPEIPQREPGNSWSGGMTEEELKATIWTKPKYKPEVTFREWTRGGFLRHAQIKELLF